MGPEGCPLELARPLAHSGLHLRAAEGGKRSGVCNLAHEEEAAWRRLKRWFNSWEADFAEVGDDHAGPGWSQQELAEWTGPVAPSGPGSRGDRRAGADEVAPSQVAFEEAGGRITPFPDCEELREFVSIGRGEEDWFPRAAEAARGAGRYSGAARRTQRARPQVMKLQFLRRRPSAQIPNRPLQLNQL